MATTSTEEEPLTADQSRQLDDDGYLVLREVIPDEALEPVRQAMAAVVSRLALEWRDAGLISDLHEDAPFTTRWILIRRQLPALRPVTWRRVLVSRAVYALWQRPELTGRMRSRLGDELWAHDTWNGRPREPRAPVQQINWHQDSYYLRRWAPVDGPILTCWIPLVPVDARSGCLQIRPGSHRFGTLPRKMDEFHSFSSVESAINGPDLVTLAAKPGDVVIFTESTVHRALPNEADYVRWSIDIRFARDSAAMRTKAPGGYLCRTAFGERIESYEEWAAKYDPRTGAMAPELRMVDRMAARSGAMGRDIETF